MDRVMRPRPYPYFIMISRTEHTTIIAGPCAVESYGQMDTVCQTLHRLGITHLRGGCFKPRTSCNTFRGLGSEGLRIMSEMRRKYSLTVITEVRDTKHLDEVAETADIIQIGAKSMFDNDLLLACGELKKTVVLKRNFAATVKELVSAAEFISSRGNDDIILCERGIRSFENNTRFTLDLCGVSWLKENTQFPIIVDPSHAMGLAYGIPDLARASVAMGIDGLMIEIHPEPSKALSDARQQLDMRQFEALYTSLLPIAKAIGKTII